MAVVGVKLSFEELTKAQTYLQQLGLYDGEVDGIYGRLSEAAFGTVNAHALMVSLMDNSMKLSMVKGKKGEQDSLENRDERSDGIYRAILVYPGYRRLYPMLSRPESIWITTVIQVKKLSTGFSFQQATVSLQPKIQFLSFFS